MGKAFLASAFRPFLVALVVGVALVGAYRTSWGRDTFIDVKRQFRQTLHLPKLWVRKFNTDVSGASKVGCPKSAIVIVTGGQSNAANTVDSLDPGDPARPATMFFHGSCYLLKDPVLGATGTGGSLWTTLGVSLARSTGKPVVFINGAVGGTQLGDWIDSRSGYTDRLLSEMHHAASIGLYPNVVLWIQGETDAYALTSPNEYVFQLDALLKLFGNAGFPQKSVPWIVYKSTRCMHRRGNGPDIEKALSSFISEREGLTLGPNATRLGDGFRRDGCHFNGLGRKVLTDATLPLVEALLPPPANQ